MPAAANFMELPLLVARTVKVDMLIRFLMGKSGLNLYLPSQLTTMWLRRELLGLFNLYILTIETTFATEAIAELPIIQGIGNQVIINLIKLDLAIYLRSAYRYWL